MKRSAASRQSCAAQHLQPCPGGAIESSCVCYYMVEEKAENPTLIGDANPCCAQRNRLGKP